MDYEQGQHRPTEKSANWEWRIVKSAERVPDPWGFLEYLGMSRGECSIIKKICVTPRSGRFNDHTNCYLLLGGPSGPQDMGFRDCLPAGEGFVSLRTQGGGGGLWGQ